MHTATLRLLVDTIETVGRGSLFARDPRLHHFVRGLLLSRAGQHESAVSEFRAAITSPTFGYTRINYELAQSLLVLNRAGEAIPLLEEALRGGIEGSGFYITDYGKDGKKAQASSPPPGDTGKSAGGAEAAAKEESGPKTPPSGDSKPGAEAKAPTTPKPAEKSSKRAKDKE